ncbi:MAG TPA: hypothetical protein VFY79_05220 [Dehalococcoidia bacterium]|nr:hypothetical protein [Dehalococcoidia bacterium]
MRASTIRRIALALAATLALAMMLLVRDAPLRAFATAPAPANDNFSARTRIEPPFSPPGADSLPADQTQPTDGATLEAGETAPCAPVGATVWFEFTADRTTTIALDTTGSSFDTVLAVYTLSGLASSPPGGSLAPVACDDNGLGAQSRVTFAVQPQQQYYIQAGGKNGTTGTLHLHADCSPACAPKNDMVADALNIDASVMPGRDTRSTAAATLERGEPAGCAGIGATVWYRVATLQALKLVVTTQGSTFDTVLAVYRQGAAFLPSPPGGMTQVACDDNGLGRQSKLTIDTEPGDIFYIQAGGASGTTGMLTVNFDCIPACPPANDAFTSGWGLGLPFDESFDTTGATVDPGEQLPCGQMRNTVWYHYLYTPAVWDIALSTAGSDAPAVVAVYRVSYDDGVNPTPGNVALVRCSDRTSTTPLRFTTEANTEYAVQVGTRAGSPGLVQFHGDCDPAPCPPQNDDIAQAYDVDAPWGLPGVIGYDTRGATTEPGEPLPCGGIGKTSWLRLRNYDAGTLRFDTAGSDFSTVLAVYEAPDAVASVPFSALHPVACAASDASGAAHLSWQPHAGSAYFLQVGGVSGDGGQVVVNGQCDGCPPPNDDAASAIYIGPGTNTSVDLTNATLEQAEPQSCGAIDASAWYVLVGVSGSITLSSEGSVAPAAIAVYDLEGFSPPPGALSNVACSTVTDAAAAATFGATLGRTYYVQVAAPTGATRGVAMLHINCPGCSQNGGGTVTSPDAGGVTGPDTGSGGYLPYQR